MQDREETAGKFRLASDLHEQLNLDTLTNRVLKTEVPVELGQLLGVVPELSNRVGDALRRKRYPNSSSGATVVHVDTDVDGIAGYGDAYVVGTTAGSNALYTCGSGRARVMVDDAIKVDALLDGGSEVCLMPCCIFEKLNLPIDTDINWNIHGYDQPEQTKKEVEAKGAVGVCHDLKLSIGGVDATLPVFIVEHCNSDLLLSRLWERLLYVQYDNRDDGSLWVEIRSIDGRRCAKFCVAKADHERNRPFVRDADDAGPSCVTPMTSSGKV